MKNIIYIICFSLLSIAAAKAQVPVANMSINCPATPNVPGTQFIVNANYSYSNVASGNIVVVVKYNDAVVQYNGGNSSIVPVISGPTGGIKTLTYTFPVSNVNNSTGAIPMFFLFRCPSTCFGTAVSANFTGDISTSTLSNIPATPCTMTSTIANNWSAVHGYPLYDCTNNRVTFRIDLYGSTCFQINNPKLLINSSIPGSVLSSTSGTVSGNTIQLSTLYAGVYYQIYYTIQLPCTTTAPSILTSTAQLTGDNCNNPVSNIVPIANAVFNVPANSITSASMNQSTSSTQNSVSVCNSGGATPVSINLTTVLPLVKINTITLTGGASATMSLYDCANNLITTTSTFPITAPPLLSKVVYTITNIPTGQCAYVNFVYDKTNSCSGPQTAACTGKFKTTGDYASYVASGACNCSTTPAQLFSTVETQYCIKPEIQCNNSSRYNQSTDTCYKKNDFINIFYDFQNNGTADLLNGTLTYNIPASVTYAGNLTVNGNPTTGSVSGNVLTIPLPTIPFTGAPTQHVQFQLQVNPTAVYGSYSTLIAIQGSNLPSQAVGNNWNCPSVFNICINPNADIDKLVKGSQDASFSTSGSGMAGTTATYQITVNNKGNAPITAIEVLDRTPQAGDKMITTCTPRGSLFSMNPVANPLTPISLNPLSTFSSSPSGGNNLPSSWTGVLIPALACNTAATFAPGTGNTIKVNLPNPILPFSSYTFELKVLVDPNAKAGDMACNSVALKCYTQYSDGSTRPMDIVESGLACLTVAPPPCNNCDGLLASSTLVANPGIISPAGSPFVIKTGTITITTLKPVQEIHVSLADLKYSWDKDGCINCKGPAITRGCLFPMSTTQNIGPGGANGYLVWDDFTGFSIPSTTAITECPEELVWKLGVMLQPGTYTIPIQLTLPKPTIEDCCTLHIDKFDVKVSLKDADCKMCESIIKPSTDDCCTGSKWINKQMSWDLSAHTGEMSKSSQAKPDKKQLDEIFEHNKLVQSGIIADNPLPWYQVTPVECNREYTIMQGTTRTFSGSYACNTSLENCTSSVLISIKTLSGNLITVVNQPSAVTQTFNLPGVYEVTYTALCGGKKCNECKFRLVVTKNCCPAIKVGPSTIATKNFKGTSLPPQTMAFPPVQTYSSFGNVSVNPNYSCQEGCVATYTWTRQHKNASGQFVNVPNGGGSGVAPLSIPVPSSGTDRIVIAVKCGDQVCNSSIEIFNLENGLIQSTGPIVKPKK
jgi:hypothetical protein